MGRSRRARRTHQRDSSLCTNALDKTSTLQTHHAIAALSDDGSPPSYTESTPVIQAPSSEPLTTTTNPHQTTIIPSTTTQALSFPYSPHLLNLGIPAPEWFSFTASLASAASLTGKQKAKAIAAGLGVGAILPRLGIAVGKGVWRRELGRSVVGGGGGVEEVDGKGEVGESVGEVLKRWNEVWMARGVRVGLVSPGVEVGAGLVGSCGDCGECERRQRRCGGRRRECGQGKGCGGRKRRRCDGDGRKFKILVEKVEAGAEAATPRGVSLLDGEEFEQVDVAQVGKGLAELELQYLDRKREP